MENAISKIDARTLMIGLDEGVYTRAEVSDWVDARILETSRPSESLLELTLLSRRSIDEIIDLLSPLAVDRPDCFRTRVSMIAQMYRDGRLSFPAAIDRLNNARWLHEDEPDSRRIEWLDYAYYDAKEEIQGSLHDVKRELEALLDELVPPA